MKNKNQSVCTVSDSRTQPWIRTIHMCDSLSNLRLHHSGGNDTRVCSGPGREGIVAKARWLRYYGAAVTGEAPLLLPVITTSSTAGFTCLFHGDFVALAPRHAHAGVHVVDLRRGERHLLVVVPIADVDLFKHTEKSSNSLLTCMACFGRRQSSD